MDKFYYSLLYYLLVFIKSWNCGKLGLSSVCFFYLCEGIFRLFHVTKVRTYFLVGSSAHHFIPYIAMVMVFTMHHLCTNSGVCITYNQALDITLSNASHLLCTPWTSGLYRRLGLYIILFLIYFQFFVEVLEMQLVFALYYSAQCCFWWFD